MWDHLYGIFEIKSWVMWKVQKVALWIHNSFDQIENGVWLWWEQRVSTICLLNLRNLLTDEWSMGLKFNLLSFWPLVDIIDVFIFDFTGWGELKVPQTLLYMRILWIDGSHFLFLFFLLRTIHHWHPSRHFKCYVNKIYEASKISMIY